MRNSLLIANHKHEGIIKNGRSGSRKSTQGYGGNDDIVSASASILTLESTWVGRRPWFLFPTKIMLCYTTMTQFHCYLLFIPIKLGIPISNWVTASSNCSLPVLKLHVHRQDQILHRRRMSEWYHAMSYFSFPRRRADPICDKPSSQHRKTSIPPLHHHVLLSQQPQHSFCHWQWFHHQDPTSIQRLPWKVFWDPQ